MTEFRIPVTHGRFTFYALVDEEDFERLNSIRWYLTGRGYAKDSGGRYMARLVYRLEPGDPRAVHHINEDKLDNRRANLSLHASRAEANRQPHPRWQIEGKRRHPKLIPFEELLAMAKRAA